MKESNNRKESKRIACLMNQTVDSFQIRDIP